VHHRHIFAVAQCTEDSLLGARRPLKKRQRLIGMRRNYHVIVTLGFARAKAKRHAVVATCYRAHGAAHANMVSIGGGQARDISATAAYHSAPNGAMAKLQQPVIVAEANKACGWMICYARHRRRPDRRRHREQMVLDKSLAIAA